MSTATQNYEPKGIRFHDRASGRDMVLVAEDEPREYLRGWLCYRHPEGQWVTLRKATQDDIARVQAAPVVAPSSAATRDCHDCGVCDSCIDRTAAAFSEGAAGTRTAVEFNGREFVRDVFHAGHWAERLPDGTYRFFAAAEWLDHIASLQASLDQFMAAVEEVVSVLEDGSCMVPADSEAASHLHGTIRTASELLRRAGGHS